MGTATSKEGAAAVELVLDALSPLSSIERHCALAELEAAARHRQVDAPDAEAEVARWVARYVEGPRTA